MSEREAKSVIPQGSIFVLTLGEFDEQRYGITGVFRALVDIDHVALVEAWFKKYPHRRRYYQFGDSEFVKEVLLTGYAEQIPALEWNVNEAQQKFSTLDEA